MVLFFIAKELEVLSCDKLFTFLTCPTLEQLKEPRVPCLLIAPPFRLQEVKLAEGEPANLSLG